jgi:hypothetical protein
VLLDSFGAVPRASGLFFIICSPGVILYVNEGVSSRFHILRSWTRFRPYRGRRVLFASFALPNSFWMVPRATSPISMFCVPELVLGGIEGVGSCFNFFALPDSFWAVPRASDPVFILYALGHVCGCTEGVRPLFHYLCSRTHFGRYRGRRVPFSYFTRPDLL